MGEHCRSAALRAANLLIPKARATARGFPTDSVEAGLRCPPRSPSRGERRGEVAVSTKHKVYREELSPISFLERAGEVHADRVADGGRRFTYQAWRARSRRLASALRRTGLAKDDRVAFLALNSEPLLLAHFGVPQAGGILVAINTRLTADDVRYIAEHSGSRFLFYSDELAPQAALAPPGTRRFNIEKEFENLLASGSEDEVEPRLEDE